MRRVLSAFMIVLGASLAWAQSDPAVGTWKLNPAIEMLIEDLSNGIRFAVVRADIRRGAHHLLRGLTHRRNTCART